MNRIKRVMTGIILVLSATGLLLAGCAGTTTKAGEDLAPDQCVSSKKLDQDIAPQAQLEGLTCSFKKFEGVDTLHMKVTVKNISNQPQRYRINIFLDNGKAMGGLIPRSLKAGLVQPGQTASFEYPFIQMTEKPKEVFLRITTSEP